MAPQSVTQVINGIQMYVTHYSSFEEPDPGIPQITYIDALTGQPEPMMGLVAPIATQVFSRHGHELVQVSSNFKTMSYAISPVGLTVPIPPQVLGFFQSKAPTITPADISPMVVAFGTFVPPWGPGDVIGQLRGGQFEVTKTVHFRVQVRLAFAAVSLGLGLLAPLVKNIEGANFWQPPLPIPPGTDPMGPLTYDWSARITLSTENRYVRQTATEPQPFADPFGQGVTKIEMVGSRVDDAGNYTIVGSAAKPNFMSSPTSSVSAILSKLFGSENLTDCEFAYAETGVLQGRDQ